MSRKGHQKRLITDKETDFLFQYFIDEDKMNEQMRGELNDDIEKNLENTHPRLDSRIITENNKSLNDKSLKHSSKYTKSSHNSSVKKPHSPIRKEKTPSDRRPQHNSHNSHDVDFDLNDSLSYERSESISASPFGQKILPSKSCPQAEDLLQLHPNIGDILSPRPLLGDKLIADVQTFVETPEERRSRARDAYAKLQDLVKNKNVQLNRSFTIDSDPDEMEEEYKLQKDSRNKTNQVKLYKNILQNVVAGAEFLNEKYDPFSFKLKNWSVQVGQDMDDYTELLEEIYDKYKDRGGKFAPEVKLIFMLVLSGVTFHISQALFSNGGLDSTIKNNPNVLNKIIGSFMNGKGGGLNGLGGLAPAEPAEAQPVNADFMAALKKINQKRNDKSDQKSETRSDSTSNTSSSASNSNSATESDSVSYLQKQIRQNEQIAKEREQKLLAEQRAQFDNQLRKQNEMYLANMDNMRRQQQAQAQQVQLTQSAQIIPPTSTLPIILSDNGTLPRYMTNQTLTDTKSEDMDIFESESPPTPSISFTAESNRKKINKLDQIESLDESDSSISDNIIKSSSKKTKLTSLKKPRKNNSLTKSSSDTRSVSRRNIIKL